MKVIDAIRQMNEDQLAQAMYAYKYGELNKEQRLEMIKSALLEELEDETSEENTDDQGE